MAETIQNTVDRLTAFISQNYTDIETGPGSVINELLIKLASTLLNQQYNTVQALSQGSSIASVLSSDTDTYLPSMDELASNYNTSRSTGSKVTGKVKVSVTDSESFSLLKGIVFTQNTLRLNYASVADTLVSPTPSPILNENQLFQENGLYYFILDVEAELEGPKYQLSSGTVLSLSTADYISGFVKAEAYGNFSSGNAKETDKELVAKIKYSLGSTRCESPMGLTNKFSRTFPGFRGLSVCGANDAELSRAKYNFLGVSTFGKADVYVRSSLGPEVKQIIKTARKVAEGRWHTTINNYEIPGFYYIQAVRPYTQKINLGGTLLFDPPVFSTAFYPDQRNNEIFSPADSRFTKYQEASVSFKYNDTPSAPVGSEADFEIHAVHQPNILEMQDLLLLDDERLACADYLVKAVLPCMVSLKIDLLKRRPTDTFDSVNLQQLKADIFNYINTIPFGAELYASNIVDLCHNYSIKRVDLPITMNGVLLCSDGTTLSISDGDVLTIPYNLAKGLSPKTTQYFIDYYRIEDGVTYPIDNIGLNLI